MARVFMVAVLVVAMMGMVMANDYGGGHRCVTTCTFPVAGRKFTLQNRPLQAGEGVVCPEGNPSTVTFCNEGKSTVKIVGNFAAPDLGVCDPSINPYTLTSTDVVTYEQYGDQVIFRIPGRVPSAFRCFLEDYDKMVCVGLSGQRYGVSYLHDAGPAKC